MPPGPPNLATVAKALNAEARRLDGDYAFNHCIVVDGWAFFAPQRRPYHRHQLVNGRTYSIPHVRAQDVMTRYAGRRDACKCSTCTAGDT